jgi:hypothetical protein
MLFFDTFISVGADPYVNNSSETSISCERKTIYFF